MNERIKELAREAAEITDGKLECWGEFHADYGTVWNEVFAELIIQECAQCADEAWVDHCRYGVSASFPVGWTIRDHFGVE